MLKIYLSVADFNHNSLYAFESIYLL